MINFFKKINTIVVSSTLFSTQILFGAAGGPNQRANAQQKVTPVWQLQSISFGKGTVHSVSEGKALFEQQLASTKHGLLDSVPTEESSAQFVRPYDDKCSICFVKFTDSNPGQVFGCRHAYHASCLIENTLREPNPVPFEGICCNQQCPGVLNATPMLSFLSQETLAKLFFNNHRTLRQVVERQRIENRGEQREIESRLEDLENDQNAVIKENRLLKSALRKFVQAITPLSVDPSPLPKDLLTALTKMVVTLGLADDVDDAQE